MKKTLTLIVLITFTFNSFAGDDPYTKAMTEGLELLQKAQGPQDFQAAANKFERIAENEKDKWHPSYYAAYSMTMLAAMEQNPANLDEKLDAAQNFIDVSSDIEDNQSEILALQGFIYMLRIGVDPANRGQQYSGLSASSLQKAKSLDPENPRVLHLLAQLSFGTSMFFGSDTSEACNMNDIALEKFYEGDGVESEDPFAPVWGKTMAESFKAQCGN